MDNAGDPRSTPPEHAGDPARGEGLPGSAGSMPTAVGTPATPQLWTENDQRLAEAAVARETDARRLLARPCPSCTLAIGDHTEAAALSCYRVAQLVAEALRQVGVGEWHALNISGWTLSRKSPR